MKRIKTFGVDTIELIFIEPSKETFAHLNANQFIFVQLRTEVDPMVPVIMENMGDVQKIRALLPDVKFLLAQHDSYWKMKTIGYEFDSTSPNLTQLS